VIYYFYIFLVSLLVWVIDIVYGYYIIGYVVVLFYVLLSYCVLYILYLDIITGSC